MQVITTDLNRVVVELLQSLLFWQERAKAANAHNAARKKRLVSGLREVESLCLVVWTHQIACRIACPKQSSLLRIASDVTGPFIVQVSKAVKLRKAKTVIVTPNIEQIETEGGLDDLLASILQQAEELDTPVVFALSRKKLGQVRSHWKHSHDPFAWLLG